MSKVAIVFWSATGNTETMATCIAEGAGDNGTIVSCTEMTPAKLAEFDVVAFGCPAMGAEELEADEFAPMFEACLPQLRDKPIALFGSYGWGDGEWMRSWEGSCVQGGAILAAASVICQEAPDEEADAACKALGRALAGS